MNTSIINSKFFKGKNKNFLIVFITLVYLVFSCCYVTKCQKIPSLLLSENTKSILQKAEPKKKAEKHSTGNFMTRPRVISHSNKINSTFVATLVLSCLFIGFNNRPEYRLPFFVNFKRLYSIDLIVTFGNLKI